MEKILLINDCKFESFVMRDLIKDLGYEVEIANEYNAIGDVREFDPNIVIANFIMKEKQGDKLLEEVKTMNSSIRCILSTSSNVTLKDFKATVIEQVIHTPISKEKLIEALKNNNENIKYSDLKIKDKQHDEVNKVVEHETPTIKLKEKVDINEKSKKVKNNDKNKFLFCPYCGKEMINNENKIRFCPYCGEKL